MGVCPLPPPRGHAPRHCALFARAQKQSPRAAAPVHKRRRRGFRLLLHPVGHRCAPRPCIKPNLPHGLKRVALGRVEAPTGVFLRGVAGHHPASGPRYPPEAEICPRGPLVGPYGGVRGAADPMPRPRRPAGSHGVMDTCAPCCVPPMRRPRCPSIECGGERRADARARPPYAPIRRVRPLAGPRCRRVVRPRSERGQRARWGRSSGKP